MAELAALGAQADGQSECDDRTATAQQAALALPLYTAPPDPRDSDDYNKADWLGTPFGVVDWSNLSAIISYLRLKANEAVAKNNLERAVGLNQMADQCVRTRKMVQARIAHRGGQ